MAYQGRVTNGVYKTYAGPTPRYRATVTRIFDSLEDAVNWRTPLLKPRTTRPGKQTWISFTSRFLDLLDGARGALPRPNYLRQLATPMLGQPVILDTRRMRRRHLQMWLGLDFISELDKFRNRQARGRYLEALLTPELERINQHVKC